MDGEELEPFRYRSLGQLVELGSEFAVNEVMGVKFSGHIAALFWRVTYLYKLESPQSRARIVADWVLDLFYDPPVTPDPQAGAGVAAGAQRTYDGAASYRPSGPVKASTKVSAPGPPAVLHVTICSSNPGVVAVSSHDGRRQSYAPAQDERDVHRCQRSTFLPSSLPFVQAPFHALLGRHPCRTAGLAATSSWNFVSPRIPMGLPSRRRP